jgi:hypothetical protein
VPTAPTTRAGPSRDRAYNSLPGFLNCGSGVVALGIGRGEERAALFAREGVGHPWRSRGRHISVRGVGSARGISWLNVLAEV